MYSLVEWTDEQKYSVIPLSRIKEPRKAYEDYKIGDVVRASCPGFSGVHNAKLIAIRGSTTEDKKALERLAIEHVESLDQLKDTSASAARPLEEPRNICSTSESQRNLSKDKPEKRKKKSTSNVSPKKAKGQENKENREELKEQRQKKKEEQQKQKEIQLKKNKAFLSSLDAFKDMVSNNSTAAVEEGERTFVNLDNQQIMPVSSASLYQAPEHSTHQDTSNSSSCQTWTPQQTSQQNCTPQQTSQQSWVPQLASQQTCTPQQSSQQSWAPQQASQQTYTPQQSSQQSWAPQQASLQIWTPQQPSQQNWIPQSIQNQTRALQPTINPNWTTQPTPNWTTQTSSDWSQMTQHTSDQNWTQDNSQSQHSVIDQDNRDLSAAPDPASTKVPKEKENSVRRQIFPADKTAVNQACQRCSSLEEELKKMKEILDKAERRIQELLDEKHGGNTGSSSYKQQNDGKPRAGFLPSEVADAHHMIELMPNSCVYLYPKDLRIASKKPSGCRKARFLLSVFYTNEELVSAGNLTEANEKKGLDKRVIDVILDYAVVKADDKLCDLKIALRNKISALVFATQKKHQKQREDE